jgi:hypothetical protein
MARKGELLQIIRERDERISALEARLRNAERRETLDQEAYSRGLALWQARYPSATLSPFLLSMRNFRELVVWLLDEAAAALAARAGIGS